MMLVRLNYHVTCVHHILYFAKRTVWLGEEAFSQNRNLIHPGLVLCIDVTLEVPTGQYTM